MNFDLDPSSITVFLFSPCSKTQMYCKVYSLHSLHYYSNAISRNDIKKWIDLHLIACHRKILQIISDVRRNVQKQQSEMFCKKNRVLKNLANLTGKQLCCRLFLIKLQAYFEEHLRTPASKHSKLTINR